MDKTNTQAAWRSRTNLLIVANLIARWLTSRYGWEMPADAVGLAVDVLPAILDALLIGAIWFRVQARAVINRWL